MHEKKDNRAAYIAATLAIAFLAVSAAVVVADGFASDADDDDLVGPGAHPRAGGATSGGTDYSIILWVIVAAGAAAAAVAGFMLFYKEDFRTA